MRITILWKGKKELVELEHLLAFPNESFSRMLVENKYQMLNL